jgi:cell division protein FtsN
MARVARASNPATAKLWEDSLRHAYPASLEARSLGAITPKRMPPAEQKPDPPVAPPVAETPAAPASFTLQLGAFSVKANAEQLGKRLAGRNLEARIQESASGGKPIYRVLFGEFPDADSARAAGDRDLKPLGYTFQVAPLSR